MKTVNHESHVSFEIAKLLKELSFDLECRCYYETSGKLRGKNSGNFIDYNSPLLWQNNGNTDTQLYSAPTLDVAQKWLREVKGYSIYPTRGGYKIYVLDINDSAGFSRTYELNSNLTYEESQESGIKKALELILEKGE